jgi:hypothetical protein
MKKAAGLNPRLLVAFSHIADSKGGPPSGIQKTAIKIKAGCNVHGDSPFVLTTIENRGYPVKGFSRKLDGEEVRAP